MASVAPPPSNSDLQEYLHVQVWNPYLLLTFIFHCCTGTGNIPNLMVRLIPLMVQKSCNHQLRLVVYPNNYRVLYIQTVVVWDFFRQQYHSSPTFTQPTCQAFRSSLALRRFQGKKRCLRQGRRRLSWNTALCFLAWFGSGGSNPVYWHSKT